MTPKGIIIKWTQFREEQNVIFIITWYSLNQSDNEIQSPNINTLE